MHFLIQSGRARLLGAQRENRQGKTRVNLWTNRTEMLQKARLAHCDPLVHVLVRAPRLMHGAMSISKTCDDCETGTGSQTALAFTALGTRRREQHPAVLQVYHRERKGVLHGTQPVLDPIDARRAGESQISDVRIPDNDLAW